VATDVFLSHSARDKATADAACAALEARGLGCWIAPRDIQPGADWGSAIIAAIAACRAFVVVFSSNADQSEQVKREVGFAVSERKPIVPLRVEAVQPSGAMLYYLGTVHWLDAVPPTGPHLERLADTVAALVRGEPAPPTAASPAVPARPWASLPQRNSLGNELLHVPEEVWPGLRVSSTCVSNGDYREFVRAGGPEPRGNPHHPGQRTWQGKHCPDDVLDHPVVYVSHADALLFCDWLTEKERAEGRIGGERYVLPTGAQWRAVVGDTRLPRDAIVERRWEDGRPQPTVPVTWGEPSSLGLLHAYGNVFEWCRDVSDKNGEPCALAIGGGWASERSWLEQQVRERRHGAFLRRRGLPMKDGGFRVWLEQGARE
jgi:hypothetical protein